MIEGLRTIKLCRGAGNGVSTACLATAVAMVAGEENPGDEPECMCPVIAAFVRRTNDAMPDDVRAEMYGDLPWMLVGTRTSNELVMQRRGWLVADAAVRCFAPVCLRDAGLGDRADLLESLSPVRDEQTARAAYTAADAAYAAAYATADAAAYAAAYAAHAAGATAYATADAAAYAAAYAAHAAGATAYATADAAAYAAARAADAARAARAADAARAAGATAYATAYAAARAAYAARAADAAADAAAYAAREAGAIRKSIWVRCRELVTEMAAIGSRTPIEPAMDREQLAKAIGGNA